MSDKIREGESNKAQPKKRRMDDDDEQGGSGTNIRKSSNPLLWVLAVGGALFVCVLVLGGASMLAGLLFFAQEKQMAVRPIVAVKPDAVKVKAEIMPPEEKLLLPRVDEKKTVELPPPKKEVGKNPPPPAEIGKAPWGTAKVDELAPEIEIWDYAVRLPKGYEPLVANKQIGPAVDIYQWREKGGQNHMDIARTRNNVGIDPLVLYKQDPQKSKPNDLVEFEVYRGPQAVEINGMRGARQWRWSGSKGIPDGAVVVSYRFEAGGWHYVCNAWSLGKSRADAEKIASLLDVSLCTLRKR